MFCPNCGEKIDDDAAFCEFCGTAISKEAENDQIKGFEFNENTDFNSAINDLKGEKKREIPGIAKVAVAAALIICLFFAVQGVIRSRERARLEEYYTYVPRTDTNTGTTADAKTKNGDSIDEVVYSDGGTENTETTADTATQTKTAAKEPLPGATREDRYNMSDYADNDDLDTFRKASEAAASSNWQKVEAEYFEGKTIIDVKKLDGGWRLIGTLDGNILDEDYSGIRYTNCYIKVNADDDIDIVFNYGVLFDPNVGEYGANIDQTGEEPIILSGSSGQFTSFNNRTFDVPFIDIAAMSENEDVMDITQFIAAPDGREYGFGTLFHKDGTVLNFMLSRP